VAQSWHSNVEGPLVTGLQRIGDGLRSVDVRLPNTPDASRVVGYLGVVSGVRFEIGAVTLGIWEGTAVRGYLLAVERFKAAVTARAPDDLTIALFEAANWLVSINENDRGVRLFNLNDDQHARALMYARHRIHHNWAAAIGPGASPGEWIWRDRDHLPGPYNRRHDKPHDEALYQKVLEGRPVVEVLDRIGAALRTAITSKPSAPPLRDPASSAH
jgi:hypothetical protein